MRLACPTGPSASGGQPWGWPWLPGVPRRSSASGASADSHAAAEPHVDPMNSLDVATCCRVVWPPGTRPVAEGNYGPGPSARQQPPGPSTGGGMIPTPRPFALLVGAVLVAGGRFSG